MIANCKLLIGTQGTFNQQSAISNRQLGYFPASSALAPDRMFVRA
jgi:hypothetical protein